MLAISQTIPYIVSMRAAPARYNRRDNMDHRTFSAVLFFGFFGATALLALALTFGA